ncbi:MAG TPA: response regulator [Noviherbaspirillum sp.]|nr:response regulator [Noviherbaspirillum sp.]
MKRQLPILVVDDQWPMRQALTAALRDMGFHDVITASNGQEAVRVLSGTPVSAVISDWNMPGMTGIGLLRWARMQPALAGLPFMLVSAETDRDRVRMAIQAGVSEYLVKPYTVQDLANKIQRILGKEWCEAPLRVQSGDKVLGLANAAEVEARVDSSTILVVDDVPANIEVIAEILKGDYATVAATSGPQALQIVHSAQPPDLILLDVLMPEMDGYEVCRVLKSDAATRDIPVIFLTGNDRVEDVVRGLEVGAVDYIAKPAEPSILKARIRTHLRLKLAFANLSRQNTALAASAKLREDVARITQHDLKNPIAAIISGVDILLESGGHSEAHAEMMRMMQAEAWRALDRVNQSMSLYRMETGTFVLRPEPVDLVSILDTVRSETLKAFSGMALKIRFAASDGTEPPAGCYIVQGERGLCHSLFGNLLRNAAEASQEGGAIDVRFSAGEAGVTVSIRNDGTVPSEIRDRFFEKYVTAGKPDGTGLGTYSAKLVTEAQQGTIAMVTDEKAGTTLTVTLPAPAVKE